ncbi:MAG: DUF1987 domain-containing protein [Bacteroidia bacterium]
MDLINIESTSTSPSVKFDAKQGKLEIAGKSIPDDAVNFFKPLVDSLEQYASNPVPSMEVDVKLEYFNTASSKCILMVLNQLKTMQQHGCNVVINWYYEEDDEDMQEAGVDYQAIVNLTFNMKPVQVE